ncbi:MAG: MBL fold metallo-hydrolase [Defluviitaleaceae bacterium]|nr:MBL fold metallo-hydrolase [Defluviitaleaceae bacterium]
MKNQKRHATRSVRKRAKNQNSKRGLPFFIAMFCIMVFAAAYYFAGDLLFPELQNKAILSAEGEIIVSFLDIGQGDSIVIRSSEHAVLIDAGEHRNRNVVLDYLKEVGITRLDYVVATHPHSDHIGGLVTVLRDFEIGLVLMPEVTNDSQIFENFLDVILNNHIDTHFPVPGEVFRAGIIELTAVSPPPDGLRGVNNNSLVMRLEHGQTSFLFTGDAETDAEHWIVQNTRNLRSNVLKIGHHGSRTSTSEEFLDAVIPSIAVLQVGNNQWGHPHEEILQRLKSRGISIYRTDELGTIRMITNGQAIYFP